MVNDKEGLQGFELIRPTGVNARFRRRDGKIDINDSHNIMFGRDGVLEFWVGDLQDFHSHRQPAFSLKGFQVGSLIL